MGDEPDPRPLGRLESGLRSVRSAANKKGLEAFGTAALNHRP